jgi:hypothetical protein
MIKKSRAQTAGQLSMQKRQGIAGHVDTNLLHSIRLFDSYLAHHRYGKGSESKERSRCISLHFSRASIVSVEKQISRIVPKALLVEAIGV